MIYYKNTKTDDIILPTTLNDCEDENNDHYWYEYKLNIYYLELLLNILTKKQLEIFLLSLELTTNESIGFPIYYGYTCYYDYEKDCASYYSLEEIYNILCDVRNYKRELVEKTFKKLLKANVVIIKKSYINKSNDTDYVLFLNDYLVTYDNQGVGVGQLKDLEYDDENIVKLESYCIAFRPIMFYERGSKINYSQIDRSSKDSREWAEQIKVRDNYICQCCGSNEKYGMASHHILNWSSHEDKRYELANGICLCEKCHNPFLKGSFHQVYGVKNNTPEQLLEYIKNKRKELNIIDKEFIRAPFLLEHIEDV